MGGCRCSYRNCPNGTKSAQNVHFFHYPVKQKERCKIWIENARKPAFLNLEEDQLRNKVICEMHFEEKWFPNYQKKRLLQGAIPTLDGDSVEEVDPTTMYMVDPNDIQVLPTNDDGTHFILDTDSFMTKSIKVESFIYKNGDIVPTSIAKKPSVPLRVKSSESLDSQVRNPVTLNSDVAQEFGYGHQVMDEEPEYKVNIKKELSEDENESSSSTTPTKSQPEVKTLGVKGGVEKRTIGNSYLRKIKQHSREIASIKKILKEKVAADTKPDYEGFLNSMKEQLPPSLFTVISLQMSNKVVLSGEDIEFFTTIHKTSPELYAMLVERYNWNLPRVEPSG